jgi:anti-anti-sigma regulatory factor/PAS domain-containing protein
MERVLLDQKEQIRLEALDKYGILDTAREEAFDDLMRLASYICGSPIAMISLVDEERQWFKARMGLEMTETPRSESFCGQAIKYHDVLIVPDALEDERFAHLPFVTGEKRIRFYAGAPLIDPRGNALGTICVMDSQPRVLTSDQIDALRTLSHEVITQLEMRQRNRQLVQLAEERNHLNRELEASLEMQRSALESMQDGVLLTNTTGGLVHMNIKTIELWRVPEEVLASGDQDQFGDWISGMLVDSDAITVRIDELVNSPAMEDNGLLQCRDGRVIEYYTKPHKILDTIIGRVWSFRDVTEKIEVEAEQARLQEEILTAQINTVKELSTPLIPISNNALLMPIIGSVNRGRADQIIQTMLTGLEQHKAKTVILDITGARSVEREAARIFVSAAKHSRLLGAQLMITGISPEVAQTLVSLQLELPGIQICSTLQEGIRRVFAGS